MPFKDWVFALSTPQMILSAVLLLGLAVHIFAAYLVREVARASAATRGRRVDWRRGFILLPIALVPYWDQALGMMLLPAVLFRGSYLLDRIYVMRNIGPERYSALLAHAAETTPRGTTQAFICGSAATTALAGGVLWLFSDDASSWSYWFALGIIAYALIGGIGRFRRHRQASAGPTGGAVSAV